jgi:hypothetical protein
MGRGRNLTHVEVPIPGDMDVLPHLAADLHPSQILGEGRLHLSEGCGRAWARLAFN